MDFKLDFNAIECDIRELEIGDKFIGANSSGVFIVGEISTVIRGTLSRLGDVIGVEMYNGDCLYFDDDDFEQYYKIVECKQ